MSKLQSFFQVKSLLFKLACLLITRDLKKHYHKRIPRKITDTQQVLFVQRGEIEIYFHNKVKRIVKKVRIKKGDAIKIVSGVHSLKVLKKTQCLTVKQGPFISDKEDKVDV